ncbi:uncharacterized protein CLUP02_02892 [Colletotrichum lupini]|uniref:Uncharacterized protein n=1 Tax=Colletotrichum lupini TaxID=145971 RepID=A0A9Q8WBP3_9PEZI|nr:uncharacterized protein CLUP02_02892 [Colletotrichum lupini]UQC77424.1 hypothetical protein CLUP02_02892 [Colletotrichum lupini]
MRRPSDFDSHPRLPIFIEQLFCIPSDQRDSEQPIRLNKTPALFTASSLSFSQQTPLLDCLAVTP